MFNHRVTIRDDKYREMADLIRGRTIATDIEEPASTKVRVEAKALPAIYFALVGVPPDKSAPATCAPRRACSARASRLGLSARGLSFRGDV
jgi:hypothetical protein